ncbi:pilus assembly protein CpaF [Cryobacterium sp. MP_3.1]|uniref:CpaF family protein n=1 Tax=unclassified Cryobacterium TaxID=2649013 RepID=UPI00106D809D|nr:MULTISPECIES: ATPase, T2SS/T4P/T4SS family [unclassified Cryobacterium]MEC5185283.1 pilus assembly protein CpaF [Cryobacterium sp. MP_3.1]TFC56077.1 CpaF family protein [Cryobacterium sp. TMB3-1-2]TFC62683.1 CpaF family protein [Cryobacterium sp. TMB1-7]TFC69689.1 CpaF family protein [Cryobacterium sp. TMB3-15]TFC78055.1 CpaF family protein [Cryobacterium sp. TMB3-10]
MTEAVRIITEQVRLRVRRDGVDLAADDALADQYVRDEVRRYSERALGGSLPLLTDEFQASREVVAALTGFGALQPFLDDPDIEEIWINSPSRVFVARDGVPELTPMVLTEREVRDLVERMLQASGRRVDLSSPFVDASLPDGSRLHVVIPDITQRYWSVNIRKFTRRIRDLTQLVALGALTQPAAEFMRVCVRGGQNILVSGATQTGKTTMLNALLSATRRTERIITVEETFELSVGARDVVAMQCRQPSLEGAGEITLRRLIKESLRMRPDRLVVGEVREAESLDLLIALNSGLPGMCSIHANSARDALAKLSTLPLLAGRNIDSSFVLPTVAGCIDIVLHCEMDRHGRRRVTEIIAPSGQLTGSTIEASPLFLMKNGVLEHTGGFPTKLAKFRAAGLDPAEVLRRGAA